MPIIFTKRFAIKKNFEDNEEKNEIVKDEKYEYSNYNTIKLLHTKTRKENVRLFSKRQPKGYDPSFHRRVARAVARRYA